MLILIDGYNLLKFACKTRRIDGAQLNSFFSMLKKYVKKKRHIIGVILDGGAHYRPIKEHEEWGFLVYVGYDISADKYIKRYLEELSIRDNLDSHNTVVISGDAEVCSDAKQHNVVCLKPSIFYERLTEAVSDKLSQYKYEYSANQAKKYDHREVDDDVDRLMEQGSLVMYDKDASLVNEAWQIDNKFKYYGKNFPQKTLKIINKL